MKDEVDKAKKQLRLDEDKNEEEMISQEEQIQRVETEVKLLRLKLKEKQQILSLCDLKKKEIGRKV